VYIDTTPKRKTYATKPPHTFTRTTGRTLSERRAKLSAQLNTIDALLACTRAHKARANLNETRNALLNSIQFIDAQHLRANPTY
jgi:hypothetical protein